MEAINLQIQWNLVLLEVKRTNNFTVNNQYFQVIKSVMWTTIKIILLHTHKNILNLISLKNVTWHSTFRSIDRWTLGRMVMSTACEKTPMEIPLWASHVSQHNFIPFNDKMVYFQPKFAGNCVVNINFNYYKWFLIIRSILILCFVIIIRLLFIIKL